MDRIIRVKGKGSISIKPDRIRLLLNLVGEETSYEKTMEKSAAESNRLRDIFEKLGFDRAELKTLSFHIDTKYESYQDKDKAWKQRFVGYEFRHNMKVEFDADNELLGRVLYALANASVCPEFRIVYTIKDKEAAKNLLLGKAVEDSKAKAKVLAEAAGVALGEIQLIDYSWDEIEFANSPMPRMLAAKASNAADSYAMDVEPDDIEVSDTVTVVWEIR